jgi:glycerate 2-kinase
VIAPRSFLTDIFHEAVASVSPATRLVPHLPKPPKGRTLVLGAGKAAASMAKIVEDSWTGPKDKLSGLVVTRYKHELPTKFIQVLVSGHPMPDDNGEKAARRMLQMATGLTPDDMLLCLMSGGASALLSCPAEGLTMTDLRAVNAALLSCGAPIDEMNCVRKHMSAISGGRLARAARGAKIITLLVSDVPGDDPAVIGSGPTVGDASTLADARDIMRKYAINNPKVMAHFEKQTSESVKPGDAVLKNAENILIAKPQDALEAAAAFARKHGVTPVILGHRIEGEAREVAKAMAGIAFQVLDHGQPEKPPCALISGGETTVTVKGKGKGGRNAEFLLGLTIAAQGHKNISAIACDTDGIDGSEDNAGAIMTADTLSRAKEKRLKPAEFLANNDAYTFFERLGDLIVTGPTRTNVNDFRVVLIQE